jgi:ATP-dependent DNA helicase RecQ
MGVDKSDIRTVIHLEAPSTAEAYIQEAGRGGRDGKPSKAILIWSDDDAKKLAGFPAGARERVLFDFAENGTCRRQILLDALGGEQAACSGCDVCEGTAEQSASDGDFVRAFFKRHGRRFTLDEAQHILHNAMNRRDVHQFGARIWEHDDVSAIIESLVADGILTQGKGLYKNRITGVKKMP